VSLQSLESYLKNLFESERALLNSNYPGITLHRIKQDLKLYLFLNDNDFEDLFDFPYLPARHNPITEFINSLLSGIPLEYITGYAYFYKSHFKVTSDVLIPRSETEILVELACNEIKKEFKNKPCRILDLGTGSGVIALSVLMDCNSPIEAIASDISEKALTVAKENYYNLRFAISNQHSLSFVKSDRMQNIQGNFDFILSNPPYIKKRSDQENVHHQVNKYEPHMALFIEDDIYDLWFEDLIKSIYAQLNENGISIIEGHENHLNHLSQLAQKNNIKNVLIIKDYTGRDRFLRIKK
jgi:release factor glutamine methyltransferase